MAMLAPDPVADPTPSDRIPPGGHSDGGSDDGGRGGPTGVPLRRVVALVIVLAFFGGAVGYLIGVRDQSYPSAGSVDVRFLQDMIDHHAQAVEIALIAQSVADDPFVRNFAAEVIADQNYEIGIMDTWLTEWGLSRGAEDRSVMGWMDAPMPRAEMPGLIDDAQIDALRHAAPVEANRLFLVLMREHHAGGVLMVEAAIDRASRAGVRGLAERMLHNQGAEITDYEARLRRLGFEVPPLPDFAHAVHN